MTQQANARINALENYNPHVRNPPRSYSRCTARLVGADFTTIVNESTRLLQDPGVYAAMSHARNPFGDGHAAERIAEILTKVL